MEKIFEDILERSWEAEHLIEMSSYRKKDSGLPVNIYIDDTGSYRLSKHSKRIKFQKDHGDENPNLCGTITLNGEVNHLSNCKIPASEIEELRTWVLNNKEDLDKMAKQEMTFNEFKEKQLHERNS